jgi:starch synthase
VLHLHDWHTAFIAARLRDDPGHPLARAALVFTIHNLAFRGDFDPDFARANGLTIPRVDGVDAGVRASGMALGILGADVISTVSETYAREILTPEYGAGLDPLLRQRQSDLFGIVNGIDPEAFDPATDPYITCHFSAEDPTAKTANKEALQAELGLPVAADVPLAGVVNRLFWQKGMDIAADGVRAVLADTPLQFAVLGTGEPEYEERLLALQSQFPQNVRVVIAYDAPLGQRIYAGSDMFIMPSRYEPCGLGQMIAMRYGAVPVVRRTGGLADTVVDDDEHPGEGLGFQFGPADGPALAEALRRAIRAYRDAARWRGIVQRGMTRDFSWTEAAPTYVRLYESALERARQQ